MANEKTSVLKRIFNSIAEAFDGPFLITGAPIAFRYPFESDKAALQSDWKNIGNDMKKVMPAARKPKIS